MPLFHIGGSGWALCAMSRGGRSVILRDVDPTLLLQLIATERITEMFVVPAVLMLAAGDARAGRDRPVEPAPHLLRRVAHLRGCPGQVHGGLRLRLLPGLRDDRDDRRHHGAALRGPRPGRSPPGPAAFGRQAARVGGDPGRRPRLRRGRRPRARSARCGPDRRTTWPGYWGKPEETAATVDADGWLRTGDAGYFDADGYLYLHDRIKDMIVSGGENIYPAEVENVLLSHPDVVDAAVIGVPDDTWGETVKAIVVLAPGARARRGGRHRALPQQSGPLQVPDLGRHHRRPAPQPVRQDPQARTPGALLGRQGARDQLNRKPSAGRGSLAEGEVVGLDAGGDGQCEHARLQRAARRTACRAWGCRSRSPWSGVGRCRTRRRCPRPLMTR